MGGAGNTEQAEYWESTAPSWAAADRHLDVVTSPFGDLAMDRLSLGAGQRALDIGCGTGTTTMELAQRVGPDGDALGLDIAPTMIQIARERAAAAGSNARFEVADVQVTDVGVARFDAAYSRFGVMFFSDPVAAFTRIRAEMKRGGALAFACWDVVFTNEWMLTPAAAVIQVTGVLPPMPGPGEPSPFSLADPARIESVLAKSGFTAIDIERHVADLVWPAPEIASVLEQSASVGPLREALRTADEDLRARLFDAVQAALEAKVVDGELRLSAAGHIVTASAG